MKKLFIILAGVGISADPRLDEYCRDVEGPDSYCVKSEILNICKGIKNVPCRIRGVSKVMEHTAYGDNPCLFLNPLLEEKSDEFGTRIYVQLSRIHACLDQTEISNANVLWTLHNLYYGVCETYSFTDICYDTESVVEKNNCGFRTHKVQVDLKGILEEQIGSFTHFMHDMTAQEQEAYLKDTRPAKNFHFGILDMMNSLHDAHTMYTTPYSMVRAFLPVNFDSKIKETAYGEKQIITLRYKDTPSLSALASNYERVYGRPALSSEDRHGHVVKKIDGQDALSWLINLVNTGTMKGLFQGQNQRLNGWVFSADTLGWIASVLVLPESDFITLTFADGTEEEVWFLSHFSDLSTADFAEETPTLRNIDNLNEFINTNIEFKTLMEFEAKQPGAANKGSLWHLTARAGADGVLFMNDFIKNGFDKRKLINNKGGKLAGIGRKELEKANINGVKVVKNEKKRAYDAVKKEKAVNNVVIVNERLQKALTGLNLKAENIFKNKVENRRLAGLRNSSDEKENDNNLSDKHKAFISKIAGEIKHYRASGGSITVFDIVKEQTREYINSQITTEQILKMTKNVPLRNDKAKEVVDEIPSISDDDSDNKDSMIDFGGMSMRIHDNTIIVHIPDFAPEPKHWLDQGYFFFPEFLEIYEIAKQKGITRILIDLSNNGGGFVISAYAMLWYFLEPSNICSPISRRITWNGRLWFESFFSGYDDLLDRLKIQYRGKFAATEVVNTKFNELKALVDLVYDGLSMENYAGVTKQETLQYIDLRRRDILRIQDDNKRASAFLAFFKSREFFHEDSSINAKIFPADGGWFPFEKQSMPHKDGEMFNPPSSQYTDVVTRRWGRPAMYSQRSEFKICSETIDVMSSIAPDYDRDYWTEIAFLTDGTCGSACSLFTQNIQLSNKAVAFSYGALVNQPVDVSSFAGGNVLEYENYWKEAYLAAKVGQWATFYSSDWARLHHKSWVNSPIAMPTGATARFNFNMMFAQHLGPDALPRQWYIIPANRHVNMWAHDEVGRIQIHNEVVTLDWEAARLTPQFPEFGYCINEHELENDLEENELDIDVCMNWLSSLPGDEKKNICVSSDFTSPSHTSSNAAQLISNCTAASGR